MTQGTAVQALARGRERVLGSGAATARPPSARWARSGRRRRSASASPRPGGDHYLMYSFSPGLRILNGDLQAITGLRDLAVLGRSRGRAHRSIRRGERAARAARSAGFDTGAWSLYSQSGPRVARSATTSSSSTFLGNLCRRTDGRTYCSAQRRFARYEREPPRIRLARLDAAARRARHRVRFSLSKLAVACACASRAPRASR